MAIKFEYGKDSRDNEILLAIKTRGKITISELQEQLSNDYRYQGTWAVIIKAQEESGYQGWGGGQEPKEDVVELRRVDEWENCPICAALLSPIDYCQHCGERLKTENGGGKT